MDADAGRDAGAAAAAARPNAAERVQRDDSGVCIGGRGDDRRVPLDRQMFFYLPLMHTESMLAQVGCLGLYQGMAARAEPGSAMRELLDGALGMVQAHVDVVRRSGRFPGRNEALGHESTDEELAFLQEKVPRVFF